MSKYSKFVVAAIGAAVTWLTAAYADSVIDDQEWIALIVAVTTALGVYGVRNSRT